MAKINEIICSCGSGKLLKDCCIFLHHPKPKQEPISQVPDFTGATIYNGFTKKYEGYSPFEIDFSNSCCFVVQANPYLADVYNQQLGFNMVSPGQWFVVAEIGDEYKYSFGHKTDQAAMEVAREKHGAVRFLQPPEVI